jgi:hypothetical protein
MKVIHGLISNSFQLPPGFPAKFLIVPPSAGRPEKLRLTYKVTAPRSFSVDLYEDTNNY